MTHRTDPSARFAALATLGALLFAAAPAAAAPVGDVEIDPTAYALRGHSVHAGLGWEHLRVDLGAFAMEVPRFAGGTEGFTTSFSGFGAKAQWFLREGLAGPFLGVSAGVSSALVQRDGTELAARRRLVGLGAHVGWRLDLGDAFYVTPWIGVDRNLGSRDVVLDGRTAKGLPWSVFPAVHVGYRFR